MSSPVSKEDVGIGLGNFMADPSWENGGLGPVERGAEGKGKNVGKMDRNEDSEFPGGVSRERIEDAAALLSELHAHKEFFFENSACRKLRKAMQLLNKEFERRKFGGAGSKKAYEKRKHKDIIKRAIRQRLKDHDRNYINSVALRQKRTDALKKLLTQTGAEQLPMIADGAANVGKDEVKGSHNASKVSKDGADKKTSTGDVVDEVKNDGLFHPRSCYSCKKRYLKLHKFYDQLCPACASLNWMKRFQTADMKGRVALVTGGRVKIGFQIVLKLLRAGCHTIVTTRFPKNAALRFSKEKNFGVWGSRLDIFGIDFRNIKGVEHLCAYIMSQYKRLDFIIHNACQTVRRPAVYYAPLLKHEKMEMKALPIAVQATLEKQNLMMQSVNVKRTTYGSLEDSKMNVDAGKTQGKTSRGDNTSSSNDQIIQHPSKRAKLDSTEIGVSQSMKGIGQRSGMLTQVPLTREDRVCTEAQMPKGVLDVNEQQVDLRSRNSWLLKIDEVETAEIAEVLAINSMAPFIMNSKLIPLLKKTGRNVRKFIINVSAMEGKFYRHKRPTHPHTNMAKAALNMMTRTCSEDLAKDSIYMNSVDTGWINDENPLQKAAAYAKESNFQTPIDEIDAAARILDPIISGMRENAKPIYGQFLKDYHTTEW